MAWFAHPTDDNTGLPSALTKTTVLINLNTYIVERRKNVYIQRNELLSLTIIPQQLICTLLLSVVTWAYAIDPLDSVYVFQVSPVLRVTG